MFGYTESRGQRWYLLYFVLAFLDIVAIAGSMAMNHIQFAQYENVVASNSNAFRILEELSKLAQFAQKENAPGNDVFDSLDAPSEKKRQLEAAGAFDAQLQKIESVYLRSAVENVQLRSEYRLSLLRIQESSDRMRETADLIFSHFASGSRDAAGAYMAEMDRRFAHLISGIEDLRTAISVRQQ